MADSTAYAASGGWTGGSPLATGGLLSNYYQKLKAVDPSSGSLSVQQPMQASTQPSSLSRVATTTPATQAAATPTATTPTIAAVPTIAVAAPTVAAPTSSTGLVTMPTASRTVVAGTGVGNATANLTPAQQASAVVAQPYNGPQSYQKTVTIGGNQVRVTVVWNPTTQSYVVDPNASVSTSGALSGMMGDDYDSRVRLSQFEQAGKAAAVEQANAENATSITNFKNATQLATQTGTDAAAQAAAQTASDNANVFSLAGGLQAPNTTAVDQASQNDLARVVSQYASGLGGADAAAYNYIGQGAQSTQQAVNSVTHNTAYANALNANYSSFANALTAQQTADANASGQKLANDMQGVSQAVSLLQQQASQLEEGTKTQYQAALIPIQNMLNQYDLAVKNYGLQSQQAMTTANSILSAAGSLVTALV